MKKYIAILLVAAMATLGISACRKENSNKETKVQQDSDMSFACKSTLCDQENPASG